MRIVVLFAACIGFAHSQPHDLHRTQAVAERAANGLSPEMIELIQSHTSLLLSPAMGDRYQEEFEILRAKISDEQIDRAVDMALKRIGIKAPKNLPTHEKMARVTHARVKEFFESLDQVDPEVGLLFDLNNLARAWVKVDQMMASVETAIELKKERPQGLTGGTGNGNEACQDCYDFWRAAIPFMGQTGCSDAYQNAFEECLYNTLGDTMFCLGWAMGVWDSCNYLVDEICLQGCYDAPDLKNAAPKVPTMRSIQKLNEMIRIAWFAKNVAAAIEAQD